MAQLLRVVTSYYHQESYVIISNAVDYLTFAFVICFAITLSILYFRLRTILENNLNFYYLEIKQKLFQLYLINSFYFVILVLYGVSSLIVKIDFDSIRDSSGNSGYRMALAVSQNLLSYVALFYMIYQNIYSVQFKTYLEAIFCGYRLPVYYYN